VLNEAAGESEDFSISLKNNEEALQEASKQLARYNKAVEASSGNIDDWKEALEGNDLVAQTEAIEELSTVYADFLDLDAGTLSQDFLKSSKNLELMRLAMEGSEEAYNQF
jgi:hypothetical protein